MSDNTFKIESPIDSGGIVFISDGNKYRIAPKRGGRNFTNTIWLTGHDVSVSKLENPLTHNFRITNLDTEESVYANISARSVGPVI